MAHGARLANGMSLKGTCDNDTAIFSMPSPPIVRDERNGGFSLFPAIRLALYLVRRTQGPFELLGNNYAEGGGGGGGRRGISSRTKLWGFRDAIKMYHRDTLFVGGRKGTGQVLL